MIERSLPAQQAVAIFDKRTEWRPVGAAEALTIDVERYFAEVLDD